MSAAPQTYEEYKTESTKYCDGNERSWSAAKSLVPKIDYSEFTTGAINATLSNWRAGLFWENEDEKIRLKRDLDPVRIGEYSGFKALEIARIGYRTRMNTLFSCAVMSSRINTLQGLTKLIGEKLKTTNSEIQDKIKKESDTLTRVITMLKCNIEKSTPSKAKWEILISLTNSASYQYCTYRHYLSYLDSNIEDVSRVQNIEKWVGQWAGTQVATTTNEWNNASLRYQADLSREIIRADTTLPKAIRAFVEMDQTYGAHMLLVLIYDDYIQLRKALSSYMNLSSQLYQKANNAQSTNK